MGILKGQNLRVFIGTKVVACATSCTVNMSANLEDTSTKDTTGDWTTQEITGKSWDISVDALYTVGTDATGMTADDILGAFLAGSKVTLKFEQTEGTNNRTAVSGGSYLSGSAWVSNVSITAANKQNGSISVSFTGDGALAQEEA